MPTHATPTPPPTRHRHLIPWQHWNARRRHTGPMKPVLVDAYAAHTATGIPPGTIRVWLHRGKLTRHGHDRQGRALVDLHELQARVTANAA